MGKEKRVVSRRCAVGVIGAGVAACGFGAAARAQGYRPQAQGKLSQIAARYQDHPSGDFLCAGCPYFQQPASCVVVEGAISPTGWCAMFTTFSPLDRGAHA